MRDGRAPPAGRFDVYADRSLRREGLRGGITLGLDGATLTLTGDRGGTLAIPAALVERIRFGQVPTRSSGPLHRALIWRKGIDKPLFVTALDWRQGYGPVMRRFAAHVASGGLTRVERGPSPLQAHVALPGIILALAGMGLGAAWEALRGGSFWYWALAGVMALLTLWFVHVLRADWPRPVRDLAELDAVLPSG